MVIIIKTGLLSTPRSHPHRPQNGPFFRYFATDFCKNVSLCPTRPGPTRPGPARPGRNALWRLITQKFGKVKTWNVDTIFIQHSNLCYQNLILISLIVWKLWSFPQGSNFVNFQQFFHHNFRLRRNFWILMVPSERSSWDLSEYTLFYIKKIFFHL